MDSQRNIPSASGWPAALGLQPPEELHISPQRYRSEEVSEALQNFDDVSSNFRKIL